jgi:hypothetical protein
MATKFTYKMRSGGNGMWGRGPAQRKNNKKKKKKFSPKLYRNETKRTGLVQSLTGTKQSEQIRPKPGKIEEETKWFSPNRIEAKRANLLKTL